MHSHRNIFCTKAVGTWREYVWVEADIETRVADGTHCLACIQDHLSTFAVCCERDPSRRSQ